MARTPETLPRHELVGLTVTVIEATNPDLVGIAGEVVGESEHTLSIEGEDGVVRVVPKAEATFEFVLTDEAAGTVPPAVVHARRETARKGPGTTSKPAGEDVAYVTVDGARLVAEPARRTETRGDNEWESD